jgi:membrane peptidoglycan carboxypeptidase
MSRLTGRNRAARNTITTKSGKTIKVNRSLNDRAKASKAEREAKRAAYLSTLPKERWKRWAYRLKPKHLVEFWFSRDGALMALKLIGATIVFGFFVTIGLFAYFRKDLPQIKNLSGNLGGNISYYDSTGKVLLFTDYNSVKREPVSSQNMSDYMKEATVAIEDKDFYKEGAFDVRGILRAAVDDAKGGGTLQGGSTITQQLVKLDEGWTDNRTVTRKVKELILAVELERQYSKNDILTGYLNVAPYGGLDYGVQSAAEDYFQTSAKDLTLPQAAMLAAIPQSPSYYSPYAGSQFNPAVTDGTFSASALITRQQYILNQMQKQGYITQAQATAAKAVNVLAQVHPQQNKYQNITAPYFVEAAKQQLIEKYGASTVDHGGWKVITTLNMNLQNYAEQDINNNITNVANVGGDEEALVAEDVKTGQVVSQVGGEDFNNPNYGQIDYANTNLSPGSSMKPFLYADLIQNNTDAGAGSVLYDVQQPLPGYPCTNKAEPTATNSGGNCLSDDNFTYPGPETIRYALAGSRNVPAVKASYEVVPNDTSANYTKSINKWIDTANSAIGYKKAYACYQQGVNVASASTSQQTQCYGSAALGSGDIALDQEVNGDVTLARLGTEIPQTYILNITDSAGKNVYQWHQPQGTQVYKPDTAYIIDSILDDPRATYLQPYQKFQNYDGWDIAVKTGTENQEYNGVMTAWSSQYAVIGFAGYHTLDKPLEEGHFEDITEPISRTWMEQALNTLHTKPVNWTAPTGVKSIPGFVQRVSTGYGAEVPGPTDDLYPSWYTGKNSSTEEIDKVSGLKATSCTPSLAREYEGGSNDNTYSIDIFYPKMTTTSALEGGTASTPASSATDNVHSCNDSPPTVSVTATDSNSGQANVCDNKCTVTVTATQGTHPLSGGSYTTYPAGTVSVSLGGKVINTANIPSGSSNVYSYSFNYSPTSTGSGALTATAVDSVLYSGSGSDNISYAAAGPITITSPSNGASVPDGALTVNWSGGSGTYNVTVSGGVGCTTTGTNCTVQLPNPGSYTLDISDTNGDSSTPITITGT